MVLQPLPEVANVQAWPALWMGRRTQQPSYLLICVCGDDQLVLGVDDVKGGEEGFYVEGAGEEG